MLCVQGVKKVQDVFTNKISENQISSCLSLFIWESSWLRCIFFTQKESYCQWEDAYKLHFYLNVKVSLSTDVSRSVAFRPVPLPTHSNPTQGPARNPSRTGPLLPERAVVECEVDLHPPKKKTFSENEYLYPLINFSLLTVPPPYSALSSWR